MTKVYEISEEEYLERNARMLEARGATVKEGRARTIDPERIRAILAEVPPLELEPGRRYRVRVYGGTPEQMHAHVHTEDGREYAIDYPDVPLERAAWTEIEAAFVRRGGAADGPFRNLLLFRIGVQWAAIADIDVQRLEEIA